MLTTLQKKQQGLSLLEVLLALAIGLAITVLSIQQYLSYRRDADIIQLQSNIDLLFTSMTNYFKANCDKPAFKQQTGTNIVDLDTLMTQGYLTLPNNLMPISPLVNSEGLGQGYILQFNQYLEGNDLPDRTVSLSNDSTAPVGKISIWRAQVAVEMFDTGVIEQYQQLLSAQCIASYSGAALGVGPCSATANITGNYLVFERAPSFSNAKLNTNYWPTIPTVKQFKQMYQTSPILLLISSQAERDAQYYVCGS